MRVRLIVALFSGGASLLAAEAGPGPKAASSTEPASKTASAAEPLPPIFAPRSPPAEAKPGAARPASATRPAPAPTTGRAISPELSAKLSTLARALPAAVAGSSTSGATSASTRDSADAVQLKPYVVREKKLPALKDREMLTPKGLLALARQRYPAMTDADAMRHLNEDFERERLQEGRDWRGLLELGRTPLSPGVKWQINEALNRPIDLPRDFSPPSRLPR